MGREGSSDLKKPTVKSGQRGMNQVPCCLCDRWILDTLKTVKNHVLRMHIRPLKCGSCGLRFGKPYEFKRHRNGVCKNKPQDPQFGSVAEYTTKLYKELNTRKNKREIDDLLHKANRRYLDGCKDIDTDQDGEWESDPEFSSNSPPPLEILPSKHTQTKTEGLGYEDDTTDDILYIRAIDELARWQGPLPPDLISRDHIMDLKLAVEELGRFLVPLPQDLSFYMTQVVIWDHCLDPSIDYAGMLAPVQYIEEFAKLVWEFYFEFK